MNFTRILAVLPLIAYPAAAESVPLFAGIEAHIGLILLIVSVVIILLLILMILYLHSIAEHLNWIRRIR
ncbi:MAG: hypothetical protein V1875_10225 [Candidatus Altiarchaeota archaeon]